VFEPDHVDDEFPGESWDDDEHLESLPPSTWRRPLLIAVASVTLLAMALVPLYNVLFARPVADNGLEICGFDYCIVQDAIRDAGLDLVMSSLSSTYLDESEARLFAGEAARLLGIDEVGLQVVDDLDGRLGGVYDPSTRSISIERPARAWTVLHEIAHAVETGHGDGFQSVLIELTRRVHEGS
jgi:hypothetical protein